MLIRRVPKIKGTSPLIITFSEILSRTTSIRPLIAKSARPKVIQTKGRRISFTIGRTRRERAVKTAPAIRSSFISRGTEKPGMTLPAKNKANELINTKIMAFPKKFIL